MACRASRGEAEVTPMTVAEREHLAQQYAGKLAPWLRFAVAQRDAGMIADLIAGLDMQQLLALAVVLAADGPESMSRPDDGDIDEVAVARVVDGDRVPLSPPEQVRAARIMQRRGHTWDEMQRVLGVSRCTLSRLLKSPEQAPLFEHERQVAS
jgi:hypothetical protein